MGVKVEGRGGFVERRTGKIADGEERERGTRAGD